MKKGKLFKALTILLFSGVVLAGCSSNDNSDDKEKESETSQDNGSEESSDAVSAASLQDGDYSLKELNDQNGYHVEFSIKVADGKITESNYDYVNSNGDSKKDDEEYNTAMKDKSGVDASEYIPKLNEELLKAQNPQNVEVVSGATHSSHAFQNYAQQLIQAAQAGNKETIEIDNGAELKDGTYTLEEKNYSNGYRTVFSIVVKDGKITESNFDNVNEDGKTKKEDSEYNTAMKEKSGISADEYITKFNEELVKTMSVDGATPGDVEVVSGATHSYHTFVLYAEQLVNAAEKGDTETITVDNYVDAK